MTPVKLLPIAPPDLVRRVAYRFWQQRNGPIGSPEVDWFKAEDFLRQQILALRPESIVCGIDDFATGSGLTSGWSYFALPQHAVPEFEKQARAILGPTGLPEFHASKHFREAPAAYEDFLRLIRETVQSVPYSLICVSSNSEDWADEISGFAERVIEQAFQQTGISDPAIIRACKACAPPLFTAPRILEEFGDTIHLYLEVDQDDISAPFMTLTEQIQGTSFAASRLFSIALDAYIKKQFPHSPRPKRDGTSISVVDSATSFMVQASDVLGNFAMNYAFSETGPTTPGRRQKARSFENVFGAILSGPGPRHFFAQRGDQITPTLSGSVKFSTSNLPELELS